MLSEKVLFALNNVDDSFLEETRELLYRSNLEQRPVKSRIIRTFLIAAVLAALMAATAYAVVSIHQKRQQELRENLQIEENHVAGYQEFEEVSTPEETATEQNEIEASVQLISTFRKGEFVDVYFSISPITREEAWDAIGWEHKNAIYVIASNSSELDDAYRMIGKGTEKELYGRANHCREVCGGITFHPDFLCLNVRTRQEFIWEHFGMMDSPDYLEKAIQKISVYNENKYYLGKNLIITMETKINGIKTQQLERLIETYLS